MKNKFRLLILIFLWGKISGQTYPPAGPGLEARDTLAHRQTSYRINLLTYVRVISDANGSFRTDQNIVPRFELLKWLNLELGIRFGERPAQFNSYYHYKAELQTNWIWNSARLVARISDNVIIFPDPSYRKTNELFAVETKCRLSSLFQTLIAAGYVFSTRQNNSLDAFPTARGMQLNYPVFKLALRCFIKNREQMELMYGSYDVFNPYEIDKPFVQVSWEYELSNTCALFSYFRYQYNISVFKPFNYFFGLGLKMRLIKDM
jgi:hypothetical protein